MSTCNPAIGRVVLDTAAVGFVEGATMGLFVAAMVENRGVSLPIQ